MADSKRHLYEVIVVEPREEKILAREAVFGDDEKEALVQADIKHIAEKNNLKVRDLSIIVVELGEIRIPKDEIQKVKVVE